MSKSKEDSNYEWLGEDDELTGEKDIVAKEIILFCKSGYLLIIN